MILQIEITELINPPFLTLELVILLAVLFMIIAFIGLKLRNAAVMLFWSIMVIVFLLNILVGLNFIWFWLVTLFTTLVIATAAMYRYLIV